MRKSQAVKGPNNGADVDKALGARVRERRLTLGLSLDKAAEAISVTEGQFSRYETGDTPLSIRTLHNIAEALSCSVMDLLGGIMPERKASAPLSDGAIALARTYDRLETDHLKRLAAAYVRGLGEK